MQSVAPETRAATALARYFQALGHPVRLRLIERLAEGESSVVELVEALGMPRSRVSNHLACLRWCGFVVGERHGRRVTYRLADPRLPALIGLADELSAGQAEHLASCTSLGPAWL